MNELPFEDLSANKSGILKSLPRIVKMLADATGACQAKPSFVRIVNEALREDAK